MWLASGDSGVIKARLAASRYTATAERVGERGREGLVGQVERIACAMVRTSAPRKNRDGENGACVARYARALPSTSIAAHRPCFARSLARPLRGETRDLRCYGSPIRLPPFLSLSLSLPRPSPNNAYNVKKIEMKFDLRPDCCGKLGG